MNPRTSSVPHAPPARCCDIRIAPKVIDVGSVVRDDGIAQGGEEAVTSLLARLLLALMPMGLRPWQAVGSEITHRLNLRNHRPIGIPGHRVNIALLRKAHPQ